MSLLQHWNHKNIFDHDNNLCEITCNENVICCVKNGTMINKSIQTELIKPVINNAWELIVLSGEHISCTKTSFVQLSEQKTDVLGFIAKKKTYIKLQKYLSEKKENGIREFINSSPDKLNYYSYATPQLYSSSDNNSIKYYDYYFSHNMWDEMIIYCKDFVKNISIRHQLNGMSRISKCTEFVFLFDFKLGMNPMYVNELLVMSLVDKLNKNQLDNYIDNYRHKNANTFSIQSKKTGYFNKDIINHWFDKYVYEEIPMCVIIPSYNNINYYVKNLSSLMNQNYKNWRSVYIDDVSPDGTYDVVKKFITDNKLWNKITLMRQKQHNAQCCGRYMGYIMADDDEIICNLDGDDFMYDRDDNHKHNALMYVNKSYKKGMYSSYGCFYKSSGPQWLETKILYSPEVVANKQYRTTKFLCKHMRTGYAGLYKNINIDDLMGIDGKFLHMCTDVAIQYAVCEMAGDKHENVLAPTYIYNQDNSVTYNNSWYNLEKKDNEDIKVYYEWIQKKIADRKPYDTLTDIHTDEFYDFDLSTEILSIILDMSQIPDDKKKMMILYMESKIDHEIKNRMTYKFIVLQGKLEIDKYLDSDECSNTILYVNTCAENIVANLNPLIYIKWMLSTKLNHVLIDSKLVLEQCDQGAVLTPDDSPYDIIFKKFPVNTLTSGYYTKNMFVSVLSNLETHQSTYHLMMNPTNNISIIIALYNIKKDWVADAIESIKNQSCQNYNIVICDDMTPDLSYIRNIMKYLNNIKNELGKKIDIIQNAVNRGLAGTNRTLIGSSYTTTIACLDPDDSITHDCIDEVRKIHKCHNDCDFIYSNFNYCDEHMNIKSKGFSRPVKSETSILETNTVSHLRTYKKVSYHKTPGYDETFLMAEDKDIIYKFEEMGGKFFMIDSCLYNYRLNPTSLTKSTVDEYNDHKSFQYCKDAIKQSYYRRFFNNKCKNYQDNIENIFPKYGMKNFSRTKYEKYFDNFFDMVYVINLQTNDNNFNKMKIKLNIAGIEKVTFLRFKPIAENANFNELFSHITNSGIRTPFEKAETEKRIIFVGELGCLESHIYCMKHAKKHGYNHIMILEDDVYLDKHFMIKFREMTRTIPTDWKFLMFGASQWSWWGNAPYIKNSIYHPTRASLGTFAIGIAQDLITEVFNDMSLYDGPSDLGGYQKSFIKRAADENIHSLAYLHQNRPPIDKCYVMYPNLIIADTRKSSIRNSSSEADYIKRCDAMEWNISDKFIVDDDQPKYKFNDSEHKIIIVDDYDAIYPVVPVTQLEPYQLIADNTLPINVHNILIKSKNNLIIITGDTVDRYIYYKKRLEVFPNITFI